MPPAWQLATNSLFGRPKRAALLASAVALACAMVVAVACAMASINATLEKQVGFLFGSGDLQLRNRASAGHVERALVRDVTQWPEVDLAVPRVEADIALAITRPIWTVQRSGDRQQAPTVGLQDRQLRATANGNGVDFALVASIRPIELTQGRLPRADSEIVVDSSVLEHLTWDWASAVRGPLAVLRGRSNAADGLSNEQLQHNRAQKLALGDTITIQRLRRDVADFTVVGIAKSPPFGGRAQVYTTLPAMAKVAGIPIDSATQLDIVLKPGIDPDAVLAQRQPQLAQDVLLRSTAKSTSGLTQNLRSSQLGLILSMLLASMSAAFIIVTGMNVNLAEQQRELAIVRCVGGTRAQLAQSQLLVGLLLALAGAAVGVPLGIALTYIMGAAFGERLAVHVVISRVGPLLGVVAALLAGIGGALWPASRAATLSPLAALGPMRQPTSRKSIAMVTLIALAGLLVQALVVGLPRDGQVVFWGYATLGLPLMFLGYFLLGVPAVWLVASALGPALSAVFRLPPRMLTRSVHSTPFRHGLTAGALMSGLGLMISIWTVGGSVMRDWLGKLKFPDAFVSGLNLNDQAIETLNNMPFVTGTSALGLVRVETDAFGVRALQQFKTTFIGFDPGPFFDMVRLTWIQGDEASAKDQLAAGGGVIVAREFLLAKGLGLGDTFRCGLDGTLHEFRIVAVVASPGLELVSKFFNIGSEFHEQAMHAVFGTRADMKSRFGIDNIQLIQIGIDPRVDDQWAVEQIRQDLFDAGIIDAGSGRRIKTDITDFAMTALLAFSVVAVLAMLIACFGVANIVIASIDARRFEFGVLRAVGAQPSLLTRLVLAEVLIIAIASAVLGTLVGLQGGWAGTKLHRLLHGLALELRPPLDAIVVGWGIVVVLALAAALPAVAALARTKPRQLLASGR